MNRGHEVHSPTLAAVVDALVAERYGPSLWWHTTDAAPERDDDLTIARRRRELDRELQAHSGESNEPRRRASRRL